MAQKRYLDLLDGVKIYEKGKLYVQGLKNQKGGWPAINDLGVIPSEFLPSYVDDVIELSTIPTFTAFDAATAYNAGTYVTYNSKLYQLTENHAAGAAWDPTKAGLIAESGKIYVALDTNKTYRWSGSTFVDLSDPNGAVKGLSSGTTENHIIVFGADGYHIKDSGETVSSILSSAATAAASKLIVGADNAITDDASSDVDDPVIVLRQGTTNKSSHQIKGGTNISVLYDADNKRIVINATGDSTKADKVSGATAGHLANLDANGNLVDSGYDKNDISKDLVLASTNTGTANATSDASNPYLNLIKGLSTGKAKEASLQIVGAGTVSVAAKNGVLTITGADDTHHTAKNVVGASATAKDNAAVSGEGGVYLNLVENDTVRSSHHIDGATETVGDGAATEGNDEYKDALVKSNSSGNMTISIASPTISEMDAAIDAFDAAYAAASGTKADKAAAGYKAVRAYMHNEWVA